MANITLMGASYEDVPAVTLPKTGGGTVTFYESGGTLIQKTITQNGTYSAQDDNADGYSEVAVNVEGGGGGGGSVSRKDVNFFDYDGTLLYSYTAAEALALSALPDNPSHSGLTAQGWNWSLADMKEQVTAMGACDVGQMYVTDDGKTRLYCHFEAGRLSPYLGICPNGTVVVDWGDGTATDTITGTSLSTVQNVQHVYSEPGDYVITLEATSGTYSISGHSSGSYILRKVTATTANVNKVYASAIKRIELGNSVEIGYYAFLSCQCLETITITRALTTVAAYTFQYCYNLQYIVFAPGTTSIGAQTFHSCYSLQGFSMPNTTTIINSQAFYYCYSIKHVIIPLGVTQILNNAFYQCYALLSIKISDGVATISSGGIIGYCYSLRSFKFPASYTGTTLNSDFRNCMSLATLTIPETITDIRAYTFGGCYGMAEYHFKATTPPALASTNAFQNIQSDCKIYVPYSEDHSILEAYKTATNWSTYASYMEEDAA